MMMIIRDFLSAIDNDAPSSIALAMLHAVHQHLGDHGAEEGFTTEEVADLQAQLAHTIYGFNRVLERRQS
jgi:hypothetical protein